MNARGSATDELSTTQAALDSLGRSICIGLFLVAGVWFLVLPPAQGTQLWVAATVSLLAAAGMWAVSGRTGRWAVDVQWVLPPLTIVALAGLQLASGDSGWWLPLDTASMGALMATAMMQSPLRSAAAALVMMVATIVPALVSPAQSVDSAGLTSYRALQLFIAYAISLVGSVGLRRAEQRAGAQRRESDEALLAELRKQSRSDAQNSLQRVLHDTALNTLEAVANGVPEQRWRQLRRRCAADVAAVDRMADVGPPTEVATLLQNLSDQGIGIEADVEWLSDPPALVQEVVLAAVEEAVRNAAKHSGAQVVQLRALVTADSLVVEVVDGGAGFEVTQPGRLGVQASIVASMESVGGYAVVASEPGLGTRVSLRWDRARRQLASMMSGMRRRLVRVFAAAAAVSLLSFMIFTVTDPGLASPGLRIAAIVVTAAMVLILVRSALHGGVGRIEFLIVLVGLALLTLLLPWSDPYCASFQSSYPFDLRALLMSTIALTVVRARQLVMALTVLVVGSAFGNAVWLQLGSSCGWTYLMISGVAATIAIGAFGFAQNMDSQRSLLAAKVVSAEQDLLRQAQLAARRREVSGWESPELSRAIGLLRSISEGEPDSALLRRQARQTAQQLRQWLLLVGTTGPVPVLLSELLTRWSQTPIMRVEGDPRDVDDDSPGAQAAALRLADWVPRVPGANVRVTVSRTGTTGSVLVHCDHPGVCEDPDAWSDEDGWWLHVTWEASVKLADA